MVWNGVLYGLRLVCVCMCVFAFYSFSLLPTNNIPTKGNRCIGRCSQME